MKVILFLPAILLLLTTSIYLSIKLKWVQILKLPFAISLLGKSSNGSSRLSSIAALFIVFGGNLGVGNISGTAVALKTGGPGFVLWMIIIITITSIIKYVTCYFSLEKRIKYNGKYIGGPITYVGDALGSSKVTILFLIAMILASITVGNLVQVNSLSIPLSLVNVPTVVGGLVMMIAFLFSITVGARKITILMSTVVPLMTVSYFFLAVVVLYKFSYNILPSIKLIFSNFLAIESLKSGLIGSFILETFSIIQVGTLRGIFATDIGLGLEGTIHSSVKNNGDFQQFKVEQSLIAIISPLLVAIVVFITTLALLVTDAWMADAESTNMCILAFKAAINSNYTNYIIIAIMFCFSFTTIINWFLCSKSTISYVFAGNKNCLKVWGVIFALVIPIGSICRAQALWDAADIAIAFMIIINTAAILMMFLKYKENIIGKSYYF
ncbi:MAG: Na+/alanine symporter [Candidatus Mesenet longicola]|uniref:Na+/alanine symporter n=1 Tax=Candidatus Mesenet longicola TaxID=1892558 RepID=A0A8J3MNE3_9RICK|nr:MAG: Na+/alanine symporter [Candidatus Mesenet longicola]GHM60122.1 MAG: Na+/alanine symporter [Candidatus Mesenet longicola]